MFFYLEIFWKGTCVNSGLLTKKSEVMPLFRHYSIIITYKAANEWNANRFPLEINCVYSSVQLNLFCGNPFTRQNWTWVLSRARFFIPNVQLKANFPSYFFSLFTIAVHHHFVQCVCVCNQSNQELPIRGNPMSSRNDLILNLFQGPKLPKCMTLDW